MALTEQLAGIDPSVPDALFRRLLYEEELGYLRDGNTITGFEVDLTNSTDLHGYALIAIQKHTILAFRSDLHEPNRLILFPSMDKLDDKSFGLQSLTVKRKTFVDDRFEGNVEKEGVLQVVAADLIPPYKEVEVDDDMAQSIRASIKEASFANRKPKAKPKAAPKPDTSVPDDEGNYKSFPTDIGGVHVDQDDSLTEYPEAFDDAPVDHPDVFDDAPIDPPDAYFDAPMEHPDAFDDAPIDPPELDAISEPEEEKEDSRSIALREQSFTQLHEVKDYVTVHLDLSKDIASTVLNAALNATPNRTQQIDVAVKLFVKAFNSGKL